MLGYEEKGERVQAVRTSAITVTIRVTGKIYSGRTNAKKKTAEANATDAVLQGILSATAKHRGPDHALPNLLQKKSPQKMLEAPTATTVIQSTL